MKNVPNGTKTFWKSILLDSLLVLKFGDLTTVNKEKSQMFACDSVNLTQFLVCDGYAKYHGRRGTVKFRAFFVSDWEGSIYLVSKIIF